MGNGAKRKKKKNFGIVSHPTNLRIFPFFLVSGKEYTQEDVFFTAVDSTRFPRKKATLSISRNLDDKHVLRVKIWGKNIQNLFSNF